MTQTSIPLAGVLVERFGPGEAAPHPQPGDFILTHGDAFYSKLIHFGQRLRFRGEDRKYTYWDHAAIIIAKNGDLIEAVGSGVCQANLSKYEQKDYHLVRLGDSVDKVDRAEAVAFARTCLNEHYGWLTIVCIAFGLLTGGRLTFGFDGEQICSGLVARAMERTSAIFDRNPENIMPADLAKYYHVEPPTPSPQPAISERAASANSQIATQKD